MFNIFPDSDPYIKERELFDLIITTAKLMGYKCNGWIVNSKTELRIYGKEIISICYYRDNDDFYVTKSHPHGVYQLDESNIMNALKQIMEWL